MKLPNTIQESNLVMLMQWIIDPLKCIHSWSERYGDAFVIRFPNTDPVVCLTKPQSIQELFACDTRLADTGRGNTLFKPFLGANSILLLDGDRHRRQRQILMPPLHGEKIRNYSQLIYDITKDTTKNWQPGDVFSARRVMEDITVRIILEIVFGVKEGERYEQMRVLVTKWAGLIGGSLLRNLILFFDFLQKDWGKWSPWGELMYYQREIDRLLFAEIEERRHNPNPQNTDILSLLLSARDENGEPMTDAELRDNLISILAAGHETTATALAWAFYWIHSLPHVREKLLQELASLGRHPDPLAISQLPYLTAICQETLRIYPVSMMTLPRVLRAPAKIGEYEFDAETILLGCIYLTHRREDLYPQPEQFKPERFLDRQFAAYEYLPFGGGNRRCVGVALAMFEMKLVLATIISNWELTLTDNRPVKVKRRITTLSPNRVDLKVKGRRSLATTDLILAN